MMPAPSRKPVAYVVLAHGASDGLGTLLNAIYNGHDLFLVHLDAKSPAETKAFLSALADRHPNLRPVPSLVCSWGGFSLVEAALRGIAMALGSRVAWSHVLLLSEQHYPLAPASEIAARLEEGVSVVEATAYPAFYPRGKADIEHRFSRHFHEVEGVGPFFRSGRREDLTPIHHASQWLTFSRKAASYLSARFADEEVRSFFATSLLSDETAFPTVLMNGAEADRGRILCGETTFVAWPHRTDNGGMVASARTFEEARAANALFIRKRPPSMEDLPEFRVEGDGLALDTKPTWRARARAFRRGLARRLSGRDSADPARSRRERAGQARDFLKGHLGRFEVGDHREAEPTTTLYLSLRSPHWPAGLRVCVLSYTLSEYAVVLVAEPVGPWDPFAFDERRLGGFPTHRVKVRIKDLFMNDQVECPLAGSGIVRVETIAEPREVVDLALDAARYADGIAACPDP